MITMAVKQPPIAMPRLEPTHEEREALQRFAERYPLGAAIRGARLLSVPHAEGARITRIRGSNGVREISIYGHTFDVSEGYLTTSASGAKRREIRVGDYRVIVEYRGHHGRTYHLLRVEAEA